MKNRIRKFITRLPGIRSFLKKWKKDRKTIGKLRKQNALQKQKIHNLEEKLENVSAVASRISTQADTLNIRMRQLERHYAFDKYSTAKETVTEIEQLRADEAAYLNERHPLVSIIIINRDGKRNLETLMRSFHEKQFYRNFEIIFVDNASTDDSVEFMETWKRMCPVTVIRNQLNMSFSAANNLGAKNASGEYLLFLNNDTEVTDGWLDELLLAMRKAEHPGAIGAKLVYPQIPKESVNRGKSFCIQHSGIAFRGVNRAGSFFVQPYNMGNGKISCESTADLVERAGVTAAVLLVAKDTFTEVGGFDEKYVYGYEDVDFCLKLVRAGYKNYYCPNCLVYHYEFGTQSLDAAEDVRQRRLHNMDVFKGKWQSWLSKKILEDKLQNTHLFTEENLVVAFAVTENAEDTTAGDYFTAMELANALMELGYGIKYLSRRGKKDWYDVGMDVDVLISMLDAYDVTRIYHAKNDLVKIAWARNWFERWCEHEFFSAYDLVLASSATACDYVKTHSTQKPVLFPIATNEKRFDRANMPALSVTEQEKYKSDYVFTGSYWNEKREIMDWLNPADLPYICKIYGANWEKVDKFRNYSQGFALYGDMPKIYWNTKIVIDDANRVTKAYGAVNSRVFDALAAGDLVLTNGKTGAQETFGGLLPYFESRDELEEKLTYYLEHDNERKKLATQLRQYVLEKHTYKVRAEKLREILSSYNQDDVIDEDAIDICGAMPGDDTNKFWGDWHFAQAMKKELERCGYRANVVPREHWHDRSAAKYIIVLRGVKAYYPSVDKRKKYIMWNISHPEDVTIDEYNLYDYVFFASEKMKQKLGPVIRPETGVLLQCTDETVMAKVKQNEKKYELLFIGNSRQVFRPILKDLLPTEHQLSVFGRHWEDFPVQDYVVDDYLDNGKVGQAYHDAKILLNDHWDDMREYGIISNRIFDALAAGAFIISDYMPEIESVFDNSVVMYTTKDDLKEKIDYYLSHGKEREELAEKGKKIVLEQHTFRNRVGNIVRTIEGM